MTRFKFSSAVFFLLAGSGLICAQSNGKLKSEPSPRIEADPAPAGKTKPVKDATAERLLEEHRANARSLLITLASDAIKFSDSVARARTLARVADLLWESDKERSRALFRAAWEAVDRAEKELGEQYQEYLRKKGTATSAFSSDPSQPQVRREVLRLATARDPRLGEEFLNQQMKDTGGVSKSAPRPLGNADRFVRQRIDTARQLLEAELTEQAVQFADPVLGIIDQVTVDFLSSLREKDPTAADQRYAAMLTLAPANPQSDANTVSLLSSYLFTPHSFYGYSAEGTYTNSLQGNHTPPDVTPALQLAFFRAAANVLLRPLAPPGQEQNSAGHDGHYLVIKRLMSLFEQRAPADLTAALRTQLDSLAPLTSKATRDRDDDDLVRTGIRPDKMMENWEQSLLDQLDHAKTSAERDQINFRLAGFYAGSGDLRARDYVDKIDEMETRNNARTYVDTKLAAHAVSKKDVQRIMELIRTGQFAHVQKVRLLTQGAMLMAASDNEKALTLMDLAATEARRIGGLDPDSPRAFFAVANAMLIVNRPAVWDAMSEAIKAANSADGFGGEDGQLSFSMKFKGMSFSQTENVTDFDINGIFRKLAEYDYEKSVELAQGFSREAPRGVATIAIARTILSEPKR